MKGEQIVERLAREVLRKLRLVRGIQPVCKRYFLRGRVFPVKCATSLQATEAEEKDDRDIICDEVFADITGAVGEQARGAYVIALQCIYHCITRRWGRRTLND